MTVKRIYFIMITLLLVSTSAMAQFEGGFGGGFPPMGEPMGQESQSNVQSKKSIREGIDISTLSLIDEAKSIKLIYQLKKAIERHNKTILKKFDANKNGLLEKDELKAWKKWFAEQNSSNDFNNMGHFGGMSNMSPDSLNTQGGMYGPPGGNGFQGQENGHGPMMSDMMQASPSVAATAANTVSTKAALKEKTLTSTKTNESVVRIQKAGAFSGEDLTIKKDGGDTTSGEESNFYGLNAAFVAEAGTTASLSGSNISTNAEGANAIFAYGKEANITASNICIETHKNSSRGLDATYGGSIIASDVTITTQGAHCAALATDRGEGTVKVTNCNATTHGEGSPGIYSTGNISANNSVFYASGSEAAVIEGKNSITLDNCTLTGMKSWGVMLYQSFSGDAGVGTSSIVMKNSKLIAAEGPMFYCTNTKTSITLDNNKLIAKDGILLTAEGNNRWGKRGKNGAQVTFKATNQNLTGEIIADSISSIQMKLGATSTYTGKINTNNQCKEIDVVLEKGSQLSLTGNSYIRRLTLVGMTNEEAMNCIQNNGYKLYIKETR
jgi:hypothetical protein